MNFEKMLKLANSKKIRKKPDDEEHRIQSACVRAFRYKYPKLRHNLFSVPNGGRRDQVTGAKLKAEGALAGVSDLIFLKSNRFYGALLIEMKTKMRKIGEALNWIIFNAHEKMLRNKQGEEDKQKELWMFEKKIATLINEGFIKNYKHLIAYLRNQYAVRNWPKVLNNN